VGVDQWRTQKISEGGAKFRHNRVTSQINFRGSAEGTTNLGGPRPCPRDHSRGSGNIHKLASYLLHLGAHDPFGPSLATPMFQTAVIHSNC